MQNFLLVEHKANEYEKYISTILQLFYDKDLLSEDFLLEWDDGKLNESLKKMKLYNVETDALFKKNANDILSWLKN